MNVTKIGNVFTSKFVGTGPSPYEKRIYPGAVSQRLRNTGLVCYGGCIVLLWGIDAHLYGASLEDKLVMSNTNNFITYSCL